MHPLQCGAPFFVAAVTLHAVACSDSAQTTSPSTATGTSADASVTVIEDGGVAEAGDNTDASKPAPDASADANIATPGARAIASGEVHTCVVMNAGAVKCWGGNDHGQLGSQVPGINPVPSVDIGKGVTAKAIAGGGSHTCVILDNGAVKCWGDNTYGQLGLGDTHDRGVAAVDMGDALPTVQLGAGRTAKAIGAGRRHTCALLDNDTIKCWGSNAFGQLGQGDRIARGSKSGEMGDALQSVNLGTGRKATALFVREHHACATLDNATTKCWGHNWGLGFDDLQESHGDDPGEMGDSLAAVSLGSTATIKTIGAGDFHTCAILSNDTVKCWGANEFGQLGFGDTTARHAPDPALLVDLGSAKPKSIIAGQYHACVIQDDGNSKCWGKNDMGQLGLGDQASRGDQAKEMGASLPAIDFGKGRKAKAMSAGLYFTCAILDDDGVKCWGHNLWSQLGNGDTNNRGDNAGEMGDALPYVKLGT